MTIFSERSFKYFFIQITVMNQAMMFSFWTLREGTFGIKTVPKVKIKETCWQTLLVSESVSLILC